MLRRRIAVCVLLVVAFFTPSVLWAEERYFILIFGSQAAAPAPRTSHTFASFVKASTDGADISKAKLELKTISWLPTTLAINWRLAPEPGRNLDLEATLSWTKRLNSHVSLWGPYEINRELFELAQQKSTRLEDGSVSYRIFNTSMRPGGVVSNCIHAVCDVAPAEPLYTGTAYGDAASALAARHLRHWMREPEKTHDWLYDRLKLKDFEVQKRGW